jgi:uncharacterized protein
VVARLGRPAKRLGTSRYPASIARQTGPRNVHFNSGLERWSTRVGAINLGLKCADVVDVGIEIRGGLDSVRDRLLPYAPDPERLINAVLERSTSRSSPLHGEEHWRAVAAAGISIGSVTTGAHVPIVFLFALFHDALRWNEHHDPDHGGRGAALTEELLDEGLISLPDEPRRLLESACRLHSDGFTTQDPTVGACWDADRVNLWRVWMTPDPSLMSTTEGRSEDRIEWARAALRDVPTWDGLLGLPIKSSDDSSPCSL